MKKEFIWEHKYRPTTIKECILPTRTKKIFQGFVDQKEVPNLLLYGHQGSGKTTVARAIMNELDCDYIIINASIDRNIDTLRNKITQYASSTPLMGRGRKYVIFDEGDYLNKESVQPGLRGFMDEFSSNCGFILTCNFKNKLIDPLLSRFSTQIEFSIKDNEKKVLMGQFLKRLMKILNKEGVKYEVAVLAELVKLYFPDYRKILGAVQGYSSGGVIDTGILTTLENFDIDVLMPSLANKDFGNMRQWAADNKDADTVAIFRKIYDKLYDYVEPMSIPQTVLILNEGQKADAIVADKELNLVATLVEIMAEVQFK